MNIYDNNYTNILLEDNSNIVNQSLEVKNISARCIRTFKALTYEIEKVVDVLLQLLDKIPEIKYDYNKVKSFKEDIEELKKYSMEEINSIDGFQINIKESYKKLSITLKKFKDILEIGNKYRLADELNKTSKRIPKMIIDTFTSANEYFKIVSNDAESLKPKLEDIQKKQNNKVKVTSESIDYYSYLNEDFVKGASGMISSIFNLVTNPLDKLKDEADSLTKSIKGLGKAWDRTEKAYLSRDVTGIDPVEKKGTTYARVCSFLTQPEFTTALGGIVVASGVVYLVMKGISKIKDWIRKHI